MVVVVHGGVVGELNHAVGREFEGIALPVGLSCRAWVFVNVVVDAVAVRVQFKQVKPAVPVGVPRLLAVKETVVIGIIVEVIEHAVAVRIHATVRGEGQAVDVLALVPISAFVITDVQVGVLAVGGGHDVGAGDVAPTVVQTVGIADLRARLFAVCRVHAH